MTKIRQKTKYRAVESSIPGFYYLEYLSICKCLPFLKFWRRIDDYDREMPVCMHDCSIENIPYFEEFIQKWPYIEDYFATKPKKNKKVKYYD